MRARWAIIFFLFARNVDATYYDIEMSIDLQKGLPSIEAILAGKFEQHSNAYYDLVIQDQDARGNSSHVPGQSVTLTNGLAYAPALARRGKLSEALIAIDPHRNGAFESSTEYSTRGAILLAIGDYEAAIGELKRAVEMCPRNAFSRDDHQLLLAKYLLAVRNDPTLTNREPTFVTALLRDTRAAEATSGSADTRVEAAITAISAMIRFQDAFPQHLYAALGELLEYKGQHALAYRAYQRALEAGHPWPENSARRMAEIARQLGADPRISEAAIQAERRDAAAWVEAFQATERVQASASVDSPLNSFYTQHGNLRDPVIPLGQRLSKFVARFWPALSLGCAIAVSLFIGLVRQLRLKREPVTAAS